MALLACFPGHVAKFPSLNSELQACTITLSGHLSLTFSELQRTILTEYHLNALKRSKYLDTFTADGGDE